MLALTKRDIPYDSSEKPNGCVADADARICSSSPANFDGASYLKPRSRVLPSLVRVRANVKITKKNI